MGFRIEPLKLKGKEESGCVFFLCEGEETPLERFLADCRDPMAAAKMATAIESIHDIGIEPARNMKRLRQLKGGKSSDLYEIRTNRCTARAYSFLINNQKAIAIAYIEERTHSGKGKKDVDRARSKLEDYRNALNEALKKREIDHDEKI